jgi:hypothetical protein
MFRRCTVCLLRDLELVSSWCCQQQAVDGLTGQWDCLEWMGLQGALYRLIRLTLRRSTRYISEHFNLFASDFTVTGQCAS